MKIRLSDGAKMPTRAHPWDAGLDLYANEDGYIRCNQSRTFDTGTHIAIPEGYVGLVKSKSGLMVNHGIITDGTIDSHYTGPIRVCLFNHGGSKYEVKRGDKIAQLVIVPCLLPELELVDSLMAKWKVDTYDWLVERETSTELVLVHRHFDNKTKIIPKGVRDDA